MDYKNIAVQGSVPVQMELPLHIPPSTIGVTFHVESMSEFLKEGAQLILDHGAELKHCIKVPIELDVGLYFNLWAAGKLLILTARENGVMVGYLILQIASHIRAKSTLIAQEEALYLVPSARKGWTAVKLLRLGFEVAKIRGAKFFYASSQQGAEVGALLKYVGMEPSAVVYSMELTSE